MAEQGLHQRNWLHDLGDYYDEQVFQNTHPEVMKWTLVSRDLPVVTIILCYVIFINYIGPALMKNRKPFDLRWLMVPYNISLVIINFYIFWQYGKIRLFGRNDLKCTARVYSGDKENLETYKLAEICWYFYMSKYIELFDTVIFVLRKKERQLSRLHKIHHSTVPIMVLMTLRGEPGGYNTFFPLANSFVHVIMYTYYGISALGDNVTIHLKFKRYVTMTQMIQFILVLYYFISRPFYGCKWSTAYGVGNLCIAGFFFILFSNFYWNEYCNSKEELEQNGVQKNKNV